MEGHVLPWNTFCSPIALRSRMCSAYAIVILASLTKYVQADDLTTGAVIAIVGGCVGGVILITGLTCAALIYKKTSAQARSQVGASAADTAEVTQPVQLSTEVQSVYYTPSYLPPAYSQDGPSCGNMTSYPTDCMATRDPLSPWQPTARTNVQPPPYVRSGRPSDVGGSGTGHGTAVIATAPQTNQIHSHSHSVPNTSTTPIESPGVWFTEELPAPPAYDDVIREVDKS